MIDEAIEALQKGVGNDNLESYLEKIKEIKDARIFDGSSRVRRPNINEIAVLQNSNGFYAAIKILSIKDDTRGEENDEVIFEYKIQTNGSPDFSN